MQRPDLVLWDFGGQHEYKIGHQMFLHDTMLALVLIDPTRGRAAIDEARDENRRSAELRAAGCTLSLRMEPFGTDHPARPLPRSLDSWYQDPQPGLKRDS